MAAGSQRQSGTDPRLWLRLLAVVCVLLVACSATVQVAHSHDELKSTGHCQICFTIHSALPVAAAAASITFSAVNDAALPALRRVAPRFWNCPLANGPPSSQVA